MVGKGHISSFHQNDHTYLAVPLESPSPYVDKPCGIAIIEVTQPDELVLLGRYDGNTIGSSVSWCNVHDAQVDTDAEGNAIYMLITTPNTAVLRVLDVRDLNNISELNYYHSRLHPHGEYGSWAHLFTIIDDRVYVALWGGGVKILDKQKLLSGGAPEEFALTQPDSIDPQDFVAHDAIPTPDGDFLFVNDMGGIKDGIRLFDIRDLSRPREIWRSSINTSTGQHTLQIWATCCLYPGFARDCVSFVLILRIQITLSLNRSRSRLCENLHMPVPMAASARSRSTVVRSKERPKRASMPPMKS